MFKRKDCLKERNCLKELFLCFRNLKLDECDVKHKNDVNESDDEYLKSFSAEISFEDYVNCDIDIMSLEFLAVRLHFKKSKLILKFQLCIFSFTCRLTLL